MYLFFHINVFAFEIKRNSEVCHNNAYDSSHLLHVIRQT